MISNYADHSANERTFLAWVRTVVAIVGFGLAASRLGSNNGGYFTEVLLLASGALVVALAFWRMRWLRQRIADKAELDDGALPADALLLALVAAMFALLAVFGLHVS